MKKYLFIALAAFALFSCNKVDIENEEPATTITYNFTVADKPSFDGATRAVKESWEAGDKIYIIFDNLAPSALTDFLILEYNGSSWVVKQQPSADYQPKEAGGKFDAMYYAHPDVPNRYTGVSLDEFVFDGTFGRSKWLYLIANNVDYVLEDGCVSADIALKMEVNGVRYFTQFCVTGLSGDWDILLECFNEPGYSSNLSGSPFSYRLPVYSISNKNFQYSVNLGGDFTSFSPMGEKDGSHYFYLSVYNGAVGEGKYMVVTLRNSTLGTFKKEFHKAIPAKNSAITFKGPQLDENGLPTNGWEKEGYVNGHAYVDMGTAGKWATMNMGASKPEDFGDFYAWGEPTPKTDFSESTYSYSSLFVDAATVWWGEGWRIPTSDEWNKLCQTDSFDWEWDSSIMCYKVTCKANNNSILLPAAGFYYNGTTHARFGTWGFYWSSVMYTDVNAMSFFFDSSTDRHQTDPTARYYGQSIRPIVAE